MNGSTPPLSKVALSDRDQALLAGEGGAALQTSMKILVTMAEVYGARELLDISSAHIDGCLYHGVSGLDFAERVAAGGDQVSVPTTLNVGGLDLLHAQNFRGDEARRARAGRLMELYQAMGCRPAWTCAPYQADHRPGLGEQIAWAESNAIVFANSVLGARTNRYGDFIDICAALTGRAPKCGLHLTDERRGQVLFRLVGLSERLLRSELLAPALGYWAGSRCGSRIPVIEGLPRSVDEDWLKAFGAAAASSGSVALFHAVGVTPEAPTVAEACQGQDPEEVFEVDPAVLREALARLSTTDAERMDVVALGSPHFSLEEFERLVPLVEEWPPHQEVEFYVCTHRLVLAALEQRGWANALRDAGVRLVVDTCVVVSPIVSAESGVLMTNSGKFAHYTPGNLGLDVLFGTLEECVRSAHQRRVWRDAELWSETGS